MSKNLKRIGYLWMLLLGFSGVGVAEVSIEDKSTVQRLPAEYQEALDSATSATAGNPSSTEVKLDGNHAANGSVTGVGKVQVDNQQWLMQRIDRLEQQWRYLNEQDWSGSIDNLQQKVKQLYGIVEQQSYQLEQLRVKLLEIQGQPGKGSAVDKQAEIDKLPKVVPLPADR